MFHVVENLKFVGRVVEQKKLIDIMNFNCASIISVYGRRRVGKTELLEQTFKERSILKFEGLEGLNENAQIMAAKVQLGIYFSTLDQVSLNAINSWHDFLLKLAGLTQKGTWTIYFEELQWLANYKPDFISYLKYVWDNYFRHNSKIIILLCGSSPSFMVNHVVRSKALYNRSQHSLHLKEFSLPEVKAFIRNKNHREILDAYLTVGGIPEYLMHLGKKDSVFISLCKQSFMPNGFFVEEYDKIFISTLGKNPHHENIIEFLSCHKFASRDDIAKNLKIGLGGYLSSLLKELEQLGLISKYSPYNLAENSRISRYAIQDHYLQFYFKFIRPVSADIIAGAFEKNPTSAINNQQFIQWLGYAFERFCRQYHFIIARILGFSAIKYKSGAFYNRGTCKISTGYQMDLVFERADHVVTVCEIKYFTAPATTKVAHEFQRKLDLFKIPESKSIHKVLICNMGADKSLREGPYFDDIITAEKLLNEGYYS